MSEQTDLEGWVKKLPFPLLAAAVVAIILVVVIAGAIKQGPADQQDKKDGQDPGVLASADGYLFCFWNVENLFDDQDDKRSPVDEKYDNEFARDEKLRNTKLGNLSKVLLAMNGGKGPDILAVAEIESDRAAELLQERLNKDLPAGAAPYKSREFKEQKSGRHIAPAVLSRLPVKGNRTRQVGEHHHRILEVHFEIEGKQLVVLASHWKSRLVRPGAHTSDVEGRAKYADVLYGRFKEMYLSNPAIDFLLCGDFNDDPDDDSVVKHLRATGQREGLTGGDDPKLFNLAAGKDREVFGTLSHKNRWNLFDQIVVSPGLLDDKGWTCLPETFTTERKQMANRRGHPWSFEDNDAGHKTKDTSERGFSDHFPVTVRLKVRE